MSSYLSKNQSSSGSFCKAFTLQREYHKHQDKPDQIYTGLTHRGGASHDITRHWKVNWELEWEESGRWEWKGKQEGKREGFPLQSPPPLEEH